MTPPPRFSPSIGLDCSWLHIAAKRTSQQETGKLSSLQLQVDRSRKGLAGLDTRHSVIAPTFFCARFRGSLGCLGWWVFRQERWLPLLPLEESRRRKESTHLQSRLNQDERSTDLVSSTMSETWILPVKKVGKPPKISGAMTDAGELM
jgi:hypothetical protein